MKRKKKVVVVVMVVVTVASVIGNTPPGRACTSRQATSVTRWRWEKYLCQSYQTGPRKDPPSLRPE